MIFASVRDDFSTPWPEVPSLLWPAFWETLQMVGISMALVIPLGTLVGVLLHNTAPGGLFPHKFAYRFVGWWVNIGRSLPYLVLMAAIIPFTSMIVGTTVGVPAAIVPMTLAGIPFFARLVENALRQLPKEIVSVATVSGGSNWQIIRRAQVSEALPTILGGITINVVAMIEYSAIAGAIGAGGLGYLAISYGYNRFDGNVMLATVISLVVLVTVIQFLGDRLVRSVTKP